jgi:hypothetical protein
MAGEYVACSSRCQLVQLNSTEPDVQGHTFREDRHCPKDNRLDHQQHHPSRIELQQLVTHRTPARVLALLKRIEIIDVYQYEASPVFASVALADFAGAMSDQRPLITQTLSAMVSATGQAFNFT